MKKKNLLLASALLLTSFVVMYSCSKSSPATTTPTGTTAAVVMKNTAFVPASITVKKGTVITWTNNDPYDHTVNSNDGTTINSNGHISSGATFSYTASVVDTIPYHCLIHGLVMSGTVIVTP